MKRCSKCKEEKPEGEFNKCTESKDRLKSHCKECVAAYNKKWRETHPDKYRECRKRWREAHPDKDREGKKRWREANAVQQKAYKDNWRRFTLAGAKTSVRCRLRKSLGFQPPEALVEVKALQIQIKRLIKEKTDGI